MNWKAGSGVIQIGVRAGLYVDATPKETEMGSRSIRNQDSAVRRVIDRLTAGTDANEPAQNPEWDRFRTVSIPQAEAEAIRDWVTHENAANTIEVGLAFGYSALHICEGLLINGGPDPRHVVIDPNQTASSGYASQGLHVLEEAECSGLIEFHDGRSQIVLPQLLQAERQFDLAFIDGNHRFDAVFLDLYYLGHLVRKGGLIILDDYGFPGIKRAAAFYIKNLGWAVEDTSEQRAHEWCVLRTPEGEDTRDFRYFVEF